MAIERMAPSATVMATDRARALKAAGRDIIMLSVGEPDFDTPEHVREAAIRAIREGQTRYTAVDGTPALKTAIATRLARDNGLSFAADQIIAGAGAKACLFNALIATLDPGDEVVVPAPCWVSYPDMVRFAGGVPRIVPTHAADGYRLTPAALEAALGPRTRWLILNSPSNPTGAVLTHEDLSALGSVLERHPQVMVLSDDIYQHLWYARVPFANIAMACPALADRTLIVNGVSKAYAMTGWRIGYAVGPAWLIAAMTKLQGQASGNPSSIAQAAAVAALTGPQEQLKDRAQQLRARRDLVVAMLDDTPGLACASPDGAFYAYPDAAGLIGRRTPDGQVLGDDAALAAWLLETAGVALVPGSAFLGGPALRLSFAASRVTLERACERIQAACARLA